MPRTRRRPSCHPDREHVGRGLCGACYWAAYKAGDFTPKSRKTKHPRKRAHKKQQLSAIPATTEPLDLDPVLTPELRAEQRALDAILGFEREKAERRRRAREDAERRAHNPLPRQHPLFADRALVREMQRIGFISWGAVERMREMRQACWSLKDIAELFGVRVSFVALATSHLNLNVIDITPADRWTPSCRRGGASRPRTGAGTATLGTESRYPDVE